MLAVRCHAQRTVLVGCVKCNVRQHRERLGARLGAATLAGAVQLQPLVRHQQERAHRVALHRPERDADARQRAAVLQRQEPARALEGSVAGGRSKALRGAEGGRDL